MWQKVRRDKEECRLNEIGILLGDKRAMWDVQEICDLPYSGAVYGFHFSHWALYCLVKACIYDYHPT